MAVPRESRYHTIDMKAVRLSPDIDPQRMKTQLSLRAVQSVAVRPPSRVPAWIALLLVGGALGTCVWWFARWRSVQGQTVHGAEVSATAVRGVDRGLASAAVAPVATDRHLASAPNMLAPTIEGPNASGAGAPIASELPELARPSAEQNAQVMASPEPKAVTGHLSPPASRPQSKARSVTKINPTPRKVTTSPAHPPNEGAPPAPSQPKLWLE